MRSRHGADDCDKGFERVKPGLYLMEFLGGEEKLNKKGDEIMSIRLQVRFGGDGNQINVVHEERTKVFFSNETAERIAHEKIYLFAVKLGIYTKQEITKKVAADGEIDFPWKDHVGKLLVVNMEDNSWEDDNGNKREQSRVQSAGVWSTGDQDEKIDDFLKIPDVVKIVGAAEAEEAF